MQLFVLMTMSCKFTYLFTNCAMGYLSSPYCSYHRDFPGPEAEQELQ